MRIVVDAFGGDNSPFAAVKGSLDFINRHTDFDVEIVLCGDEVMLKQELAKLNCSSDKLTIHHAPDVISCHDQPSIAVKQKADSSMMQAINLVANKQADAVVSSGNTGALLIGSLLKIKRISGIKRPALCPIMPTVNGSQVLLIDGGANVDCTSEQLVQFAIMGSKYMAAVNNIAEPRVALISNGTEDEKGNEVVKETNTLLKTMPISFVGNCECRDILSGNYDVCVCDGFVGNAILKSIEGAVSTFGAVLKQELMSNFTSKLGALIIRKSLKRLKKRFDYKEVGGAPLLGVNGGVIKAHGSSDERAFYNAIMQAYKFVSGNVVDKISDSLANIEE